jgi:DNA-binding CsgD family transcriptional regulator
MVGMLTLEQERFTLRQRQVVHLISEGCSNLEIADRLGISPRTAKAHSDTLRVKLRVSRRRHIPAAFRGATGEDPHELGVLVDAGDERAAVVTPS